MSLGVLAVLTICLPLAGLPETAAAEPRRPSEAAEAGSPPQGVVLPEQIRSLLVRALRQFERGQFPEAETSLELALRLVRQERLRVTPEADAVLRVGGVIPPPAIVQRVDPVYPPDAQAAGVQGSVVFEIVLDREGYVASIRKVQSIPQLDEAAVDAVSQWRYAPTIFMGVPRRIMMTVSVDFALEE